MIVTLAFSSIINKSSAQKISSTHFKIENYKAIVHYRIRDWKEEQSFTINLYVSNDGGINFKGPLKFVTGDVGQIKNAYGEKRIEWDIFREMDELNGNIVFEVRAQIRTGEVNKHILVMYNYSQTAPFGIRVGVYGNKGLYAGLKSNLNFTNPGPYNANSSGLTNYTGSGYWVMSNTSQNNRHNISIGGLAKYKRNIICYAGIGYGIDQLLWKYDEYSLSDFSKVNSDYAIQEDVSIKGLELECGLIFTIQRGIISVGASTLMFKYVELNLGGGILF